MNLREFKSRLTVLAVLSVVTSPATPAQNGRSCSLTDAQSQRAVLAFSKFARFVLAEPRCVNCHGGVNPYISGTGLNPADTTAPASLTEHGGGPIPKNTDGSIEAACMKCHNHMAPKRDGSPTLQWFIAANFHSFVDKDSITLCRQFKKSTGSAQEFLGHLTDDNGGNNFSQTAFNGDRGLDDSDLEGFNVKVQKPSISKSDFIKLAQDWVNAMGGKFQGDENCGCELKHTAWSGQIHYVFEHKGDEGQDERGSWSIHHLKKVNVTVKDGFGKVEFHEDENENSKYTNQGSVTVDLNGETAAVATVNVKTNLDATYSIRPGWNPPYVGKRRLVDCSVMGSSKICKTYENDIPATDGVALERLGLVGKLDDPNHIQSTKTEIRRNLGRAQKGVEIETVTVDLWRNP